MQRQNWKTVYLGLLILAPVLIGLIAEQALLYLPSSYVDIFYWATPVLMIVLWPWAGSRFARTLQMPAWKAILLGNSAVLVSMALCIVLMSVPVSNALTKVLLDIAQAYAMPMVPLVSGLWLFYDSSNLDAYASVIMVILSAVLLIGMFSAGYGYGRLHVLPEEEADPGAKDARDG